MCRIKVNFKFIQLTSSIPEPAFCHLSSAVTFYPSFALSVFLQILIDFESYCIGNAGDKEKKLQRCFGWF